jgi:hypothetical protein
MPLGWVAFKAQALRYVRDPMDEPGGRQQGAVELMVVLTLNI